MREHGMTPNRYVISNVKSAVGASRAAEFYTYN
jgi:hypothetical protein